MIRMSIPEGLELVRRAGILKGATRVHVWQDYDLFRRQNFGGFRHEADPAEGDDIRIGRLRLAGKVQAVAYEICEILDLWLLIVMSKDDRIPLLAPPVDFGAQVQPLDRKSVG